MKVVIVWSSPNENGLTASAKESFLSGLKKAGTEYEEVHLNKFKTEHCLACGNGWGTCRSEGRCIIKDDFESIYRKLMEADGSSLFQPYTGTM